ncbi:MAG: amidohydrolase family protein [Actinomycetota bacterium]
MRTLYRASIVHTFSLPPAGEWLLVDERHIQRVGVGDPPDADRIVELPGATILPGFVDTHVHLTGSGIASAHPEVARTRSAAALLEVLRTIVDREPGAILVHGFDESTWPGSASGVRVPTVAELDEVSSDPLVVVRVDGHLSIGNRAALEPSGALEEQGVDRDAAGAPTGVLTRRANERLKRWLASTLSEHRIQQLQLSAAATAASRGVTSVHEMSLPAERGLRDLEVLLAHRSNLPVDVVTYLGTLDVAQAIELGLPRVGGDLPVDGSLGAHTAALSAPYEDRPGEYGVLYHDDEGLTRFFRAGHAAGLQVGVHAIGDRGIEQVLAGWERVYQGLDSRERRHFRARRHRVEHFEMATAVHVERAAMLGLAISFQPAFDTAWGMPGGLYEQRLGALRTRPMNPFRSCLERGIELGVGSDAPITPLDPMASIVGLERHHDREQRLTRAQALHLSTYGGARLARQDSKKGYLEPGMHADFVAFDVDPATEPDLDEVRPILTVSLGREVFAS